MFQSKSRIEIASGVRFYEQDILFDDYVYSNDIQISLDVSYMTPGIGIALMTNEGLPLEEQKEVYLFKAGYRDAVVYYRLGDIQKKMSAVSTNIYPPINSMKLTFTKRGRRIMMAVEGHGEILNYMLPVSIDRYTIGIYSNAGNTVSNMSIASSIPDGWTVNMRNTEGGYVKFLKSGFEISHCENQAEIEQSNIPLDVGTYFVRYEKSDIDGLNDIQCFVMKSGDERLIDEDKNILIDGKITIPIYGTYNIKFKGKQGAVKNILICDKASDRYVATKNDQISIDGSYIEVEMDGIAMVNWTGTVFEVPELEGPSDADMGLLIVGDESVLPVDVSLVLGQEYDYSFNAGTLKLTVKKGTQIRTIQFPALTDKIRIFKNMDASITKFSITNENGETTNLIAEQTAKHYVPASIGSPIVVVNESNNPLDLSSSYRYTVKNGIIKYHFTNWEREVFMPDPHIRTERRISKDLGSVKVYGIPMNATIHMDRIFQLQDENLDTIDIFASKYELIKEKDLHYLDKFTGDIYISDPSRYQMIIVDYLKHESYCINHRSDIDMYEVEISNGSEKVSLIYDHSTEQSGEKTLVNISNHRISGIIPKDQCYIALRREGF